MAKYSNDYYPLTRDEVRGLLELARQRSVNCKAVAEVQCRLEQGIPGMVCPHNDPDSPEMVKADRLAELFVSGYKTQDLDKLADKIFALMGNDYLDLGR
jgi:hypothetical protein